MDTTKIVRGDDLMLFDSDRQSIAFATSHTLTLTADVSDIQCKDSGIWKTAKVTKLGWEITSDNLFCEQEYNKLMALWQSGEPIDVYFGGKEVANTSSTARELILDGAHYYALDAGANNGNAPLRGIMFYDYNNVLQDHSIYSNNECIAFSFFPDINATEMYLQYNPVSPDACFGSGLINSNDPANPIAELATAGASFVFSADAGPSFHLASARIILGSNTGGSTTDGIDSPTNAWNASTTNLMGGKAIITNITVNAASGDNATYSITLQGVGEYKSVE